MAGLSAWPSRPADFAIEQLPSSSISSAAPSAQSAPEGLAPNSLDVPADAIVDLTGDDGDTGGGGDTWGAVDGATKDVEDATVPSQVPSSPPWSQNEGLCEAEGLAPNLLAVPADAIVDLPGDHEDARGEGDIAGAVGGATKDVEDATVSNQVPSSPPCSQKEGLCEAEVTDEQLRAASDLIETVPTRWQRRKIRHQRKVKAGHWTEQRSRKRRHQAMCGLTRSGMQLYHAYSTKAKRVKAILRLRGLRTRLRELRLTRSTYQEPPSLADFPSTLPIEVPWPSNVCMITESINPEGVQFKDLGDFGRCSCIGDCFLDMCANVDSALYCTPDTSNLDGLCSNAPRTLASIKLYDTERVGLGVFTSTDLSVGDVIGEYAGVLSAYDPVDAGQPGQRMKHNTGYTMLLNARSKRRQYVYVEALNYGSTMRFISHSCTPNAAFVEVYNRSSVKVLVRMLVNVYAGSQITVDYGNQTWFRCACDECWLSEEGNEDDERS